MCAPAAAAPIRAYVRDALGADPEVLEARQKEAVRHLLMMRQLGQLAKRKPKIPRQRFPEHIEVDYAKALIANVVGAARVLIQPLMAELPGMVAAVNRDRGRRGDSGEGKRVEELMRVARARMAKVTARVSLQPALLKLVGRMSAFQREQFAKQVKAALGVDLWTAPARPPRVDSLVRQDGIEAAYEGFIHENVSQIKTLGDAPLDQIERLVNRAMTDGLTHQQIEDLIAKRFDVAESSARLIARDQLGKLNAQITAERHKELGIKRWKWRTMKDEFVRKTHAAREGKTYSYDNPPEIVPGQEINCRCHEEPIFEDLQSELDRALAELELEPGSQQAPKPATATPSWSIPIGTGERIREQPYEPESAPDVYFGIGIGGRIPSAAEAGAPDVGAPLVVEPTNVQKALGVVQGPATPWWFVKGEWNGQVTYTNLRTGKRYLEREIAAGEVNVWGADPPGIIETLKLKRKLRKFVFGQ